MKKTLKYIIMHRYAIAVCICSFFLLLLVQQKPLKYYGLWFLWMIQVIVLFCNINMFDKKHKKLFSDYDDKTNRPIRLRTNDEYNVANLIDLIKARIKLINNCKTSFILGINGAWGIGKTSIINIVENELRKTSKDYIFIPFNPWHWSGATPETLVRALKDAFTQNNDVNGDILEYFDKIIEIYEKETVYIKLFKLLGMLRKRHDSLEKIKYEILNRADNKKYVVIVDDLDRCSKDELNIVFNLVREFINWQNVLVILCYDRSEIEKKGIEIEKLVDNEIKIHIEKSEIREAFIRKLLEINTLTEWEQNELLKCATWVDTPRKLKSIIIDVQSLWEDLKDKLYFPHFVAITILSKEDRYLYDLMANSYIKIFNPDIGTSQEMLDGILSINGVDVIIVRKYLNFFLLFNIYQENDKWKIGVVHDNYSLNRLACDKKGIWNNNVTESYFIYRYPKHTFNDYELEKLKKLITSKENNIELNIHKIIDDVHCNKKTESFIGQMKYGIPRDSNYNKLVQAVSSYNNNKNSITFYKELSNIIDDNINRDDIDFGIKCMETSKHIYISVSIYNKLIWLNNSIVDGGGLNRKEAIKTKLRENLVKLLIESDNSISTYGVPITESLDYLIELGSGDLIVNYMNKLLENGNVEEAEYQYEVLIPRTNTDHLKDAIKILISNKYVEKIIKKKTSQI